MLVSNNRCTSPKQNPPQKQGNAVCCTCFVFNIVLRHQNGYYTPSEVFFTLTRRALRATRTNTGTRGFVRRLQLLAEQSLFLQNQNEALHRRLAEERREGLADAAEMKRLNRQARLEENATKRKLREKAIRMQR